MTLRICQAVDPAIGQSARADYFTIATGGVETTTSNIYLLDMFEARLEAPAQEKAIETAYLKWRPYGCGLVLVESIFYQTALVQFVKRRGVVPVRGIDRRLGHRRTPDKVTRAMSLAARYENGQIRHPPSAPWLARFEEQLLAFPNGEHDDMVDAWVDVVDALTVGLRIDDHEGPIYQDFTYDKTEARDDTGLYAELGIAM